MRRCHLSFGYVLKEINNYQSRSTRTTFSQVHFSTSALLEIHPPPQGYLPQVHLNFPSSSHNPASSPNTPTTIHFHSIISHIHCNPTISYFVETFSVTPAQFHFVETSQCSQYCTQYQTHDNERSSSEATNTVQQREERRCGQPRRRRSPPTTTSPTAAKQEAPAVLPPLLAPASPPPP